MMMHFGGYLSILFSMFGLLIYLFLLAIGIYCLILFIKLANRGIKAFDLYIQEKEEEKIANRKELPPK